MDTEMINFFKVQTLLGSDIRLAKGLVLPFVLEVKQLLFLTNDICSNTASRACLSMQVM